MTRRADVALSAVLLLAALPAGCATSTEGGPELAVAAALSQYRQQSEDFAERRKVLTRERLAIVQEAQADTARTQIDLARTVAQWRIAKDDDRLSLYQQVLGATREAGAAVESLERLLAEQREALEKADTRVEVHGDKLSAAAKALTALGSAQALSDLASRYVKFLVSAHEELEKLERPTASPDDRPPPR